MIADLQNTISRVEYLLRNGFAVPDFLRRRVEGHVMAQTDFSRGESLVLDTLQDEMDYLDGLIND